MESGYKGNIKTNYLIYGTGRQAELMLEKYLNNENSNVEIVGFVNTKQPENEVGDFHGYPVLSLNVAFGTNIEYDKIAIATSDFYDEIKKMLIDKYHINKKIIGYGGELVHSYKRGVRDLALVMIIRNEARYIREWIEYHRLVGVSHFYIYDNESDDGLRELLQEYVDEDIVTYTYWPGECVQVSAYNDALHKYGEMYEFMGIVDSDEFIVPTTGVNIVDELESIIDKYEGMVDISRTNGHVGGIGINWRNYGTSFHKQYVEGLLIENYKYRAENDFFKNMVIKTVFIPSRVDEVLDPHTVKYKTGYCCISEKGSYISSSVFPDGACEILRINHYYSKSEEECVAKYKRGWPDQKHVDLEDEYIANRLKVIASKYNVVYDDVMDRFIPLVKEVLNGRFNSKINSIKTIM